MNLDFQRLMQRATQLTRNGGLQAATAAIQAALTGTAHPATATTRRTEQDTGDVIDVAAREVPDEAPTAPAHPQSPAPGRFIAGTHGDATARRDFKLYTPPGTSDKPLPLLVMLHGCTQNPDDFAAGTAMNNLASEQGFYVLYPAQSQQANPQRCWNWFKHNHQARGRGEPALLAGMTREVMATYPVDADRVYVAGLSAGGAMAAILGDTYPDIFAAVGVHSGLAAGSATDLPSAFSAMQSGANPAPPRASANAVPTIAFHGDADHTVHPANSGQVIAASAATAASVEVDQLTSSGGRTATRRIHHAADGTVLAEHWLVHGAPHAWSGGSATGSYTDPRGPDASAEMLRFFLAHPRRPGH
ncbi:MAG: PHB depolymerase family esterase [Polaromonas sp.]|nr:PHB depolymerase family esterase [Polaromonas sp.]